MKIINCQTLGEMCEFLLDGEPVFVIRAQDKSAVLAVYKYIELSRIAGGKNLIRSAAQADKIMDWQKANPHRVKLPD